MPRSFHSSPAENRPTHTVEDYLMTMHVMERDSGEIVAARLAEMMGVAPATVAMTLKRMERDSWITGTGRKAVRLTEIGREAAQSVTRRHMLTEWLLLRVLKVPFLDIHHEAHGIEHAISPGLEARLCEILDNPQLCPHGNPLPGFEHVVKDWLPLTQLARNESAIIRRIHEFAEDNEEILHFLFTNQILPGKQIDVVDLLAFNHTITIRLDDHQVTLGFAVAGYIFVQRNEEG